MSAGRRLGDLGEKAKGPNPVQSAGMKIGTSMRTMVNHESGYIAKLMINGNEMGINELKRTMNAYPEIDDSVKTLATELLQLEIDSQNTMKKYLNQTE